MILKDISFDRPQDNILYDEVLLHSAEEGKGGEALRFWESPVTFVVLGRISKETEDVNISNVKKDGLAVIRRSSGGGTVLQGKGCFNYSLILSKENNPELSDLKRSYRVILGRLVEVFRELDLETKYFPISDVALLSNLKKISGNAQIRKKKYILHHGTILYDFDLSKIEQYLTVPKSMPDYRQDRSHLDFVSNIDRTLPDIKSAFSKCFKFDRIEDALTDAEEAVLHDLAEQRELTVRSS